LKNGFTGSELAQSYHWSNEYLVTKLEYMMAQENAKIERLEAEIRELIVKAQPLWDIWENPRIVHARLYCKKGERTVSNHEVASLACKILGIYIIIQGINVLSSVLLYVSTATSDQMVHESCINIVFSLVYILFGVLLWFFSDKLSAIMVTEGNHSKEDAGIEVSEIQRVAFSVLGLYFIGSSLPRLVSTINEFHAWTT